MSHDDIKAALAKATPGPWDEEWRAIPGQSYYEVSDQGRVRSWRAQTRKVGANPRAESPHLLTLRNSRRDGCGYQTVSLPADNGRYVNKTVHSLVLAAFMGPRPAGLEVAHLNGDPGDNRLVNLKYATRLENESHKLLHGTRATGEKVNGARLLGWQVAEIRYLASKGVTQAKIAALFEMGSGHVSDIIRGRIWPETLERDTASPTWLAELLAENERLTDELDRLRLSDDYMPEGVDIVMAKLRDHKRRAESAEQWKTEALPVIDGLQELGAALGIPLGKRITGPDALAAVKALTERAEAAEAALARMQGLAGELRAKHYYLAPATTADAILRALDGGEQ